MTEDGVRPGYWFKPKAFGYGATPVTWQGWAVMALYVALVLAIVHFAVPNHIPFLCLLAPVTLALLWVTWVKTEGGMRWRWGS